MWLNELYHQLNPIAFALGPVVVRWYGLAYLAGFVLGAVWIWRTQKRWGLDLTLDELTSVMIGLAFGVIIGARLAYVLFYGAGYYLEHPLEILALNQGGMSFHGGLIGAIIGGGIVVRRLHLSLATLCDLGVSAAPIGLFFGRCANFINGELWGKPTDLPWGVMFSDAGGGMVYRHPSQLYEALLEGVVIFLVLFVLSRRKPTLPQGTFSGVFLLLYGVFRALIEFVRVPDAQLGYLFGNFLTMGQILSLPLIIAGIAVLIIAAHFKSPQRIHLMRIS